RGRLAISRRSADICDHGATDGCSWSRFAGRVVFGCKCLAAERHGADVFADERLSFAAVAPADLRPAMGRSPVLIRRSKCKPRPAVAEARERQVFVIPIGSDGPLAAGRSAKKRKFVAKAGRLRRNLMAVCTFLAHARRESDLT